MELKRELFIGVLLTVVVLAFASFYFFSYPRMQRSVDGSDQILNAEEVAKHNLKNDCWVIVNDRVFDVTGYITLHPGGEGSILRYCGKEATEAFMTMNGKGSHSPSAFSILESMLLGIFGSKLEK